MTDFTTATSPSKTITAFFDTREAAQRANDALVDLEIADRQIEITDGSGSAAAPGSTKPAGERSFWEELKSLFLPSEDRYNYAEGLRRGGFLLSAQVDDAHYDRALEVLDTDGAVDMDEREAGWRATGWSGYPSSAATSSSAAGSGLGAAAVLSQVPADENNRLASGPDEVLPVYEETARVDKRDINHGRVRLRSYMVDTPITEGVADSVRRTEVDVQGERSGSFAGAGKFTAADDAGRIVDHMDVIASDGMKIGTVDHLDGLRIKLAKSTSPDGEHHYLPLAWVDHVDAHVHLDRGATEAKASW